VALAVVAFCALLLAQAGGCARFNTYYNAKRAFDDAERQREEAIKTGTDVETASRAQRQKYLLAVEKSKKLLRDYPGHGLTDDALFLMGKSYQRLASYRESIRRLDQLFVNFPGTDYLEEAVFLQAVNYLMLGNATRSQEYIDRLENQFPDSRYQSETLRASGDNAYALKNWQDAVEAFQRFLERFPEAKDWDQSSLRLAESLWELQRYGEAIEVLEEVRDRSDNGERVFMAGLLEARSRAREGQHDEAEALVGRLKDEAVFYEKSGDVTLVEAENLLAEGDLGAGMAMLEAMPVEHQTRDVKPVRADLLARGYLQQGDLEKAREMFQQAIGGGDLLDDPDGTRLLFDAVKNYLAAEGQLADAQPARAAQLRLIKANALLFGFERPREALDLFVEVAADTAADSTAVPRALYGAMLVHDDWLDQPDSAAAFRDELLQRFPMSAHAYQATAGASANLLAHLLERDELRLEAMRQDTSLTDLAGPGDDGGGWLAGRTGLRRRMVYLQRRDHLVFAPPEEALLALAEARAARAEATAAAADEVAEPTERPAFDLLPEHLRPAVADTVLAESDTVMADTSSAIAEADSTGQAAEPAPPKPAEPEKKKKSWVF
jgi:TolA-binding protein